VDIEEFAEIDNSKNHTKRITKNNFDSETFGFDYRRWCILRKVL
jgi:hypothetical protein